MKKTILIVLVLLLMSACLYRKKLDHPLMDNPAFDIIGDQGYKQDITLDELQGDYECYLWELDEGNDQIGSSKVACLGEIVENTIHITWTSEGMDYTYRSPLFIIEDGLLFSEEEDPSLICAVKFYTSGHMVDGVGMLLLEDETALRIHFQMVK